MNSGQNQSNEPTREQLIELNNQLTSQLASLKNENEHNRQQSIFGWQERDHYCKESARLTQELRISMDQIAEFRQQIEELKSEKHNLQNLLDSLKSGIPSEDFLFGAHFSITYAIRYAFYALNDDEQVHEALGWTSNIFEAINAYYRELSSQEHLRKKKTAQHV